MTKRRKGNNGQTHHQVPSLQSLALAQVRRNEGRHFRHNTRTNSILRRTGIMSDDGMSDAGSTRTHASAAGTSAQEGAQEAGQGLQVTIPPRQVPHLYNNNYTVKLTYCDTYRHDITYNVANSQIFRTNSIFDPDYSAAGHQPLMRDLWASMYDYYCVLACDYEMHFYNAGTDTITYTAAGTSAQKLNTSLVTLMRSTNVSDFVTTYAAYPICEMKNAVTHFLPPESRTSFSGTVTPGDFIVDAKDADSDNTWVAQGSNPGVSRFLGYVLTNTQAQSIAGWNEQPYSAIQVFVKLTYTVQFTQINASLRETSS